MENILDRKNSDQGVITTRWVAAAGMLGPILFALIIAFLTFAQYNFLIKLGWNPDLSSDVPWPSSLSLGPYGWLQMINFGLFGLLLIIFGYGLNHGIVKVSWGIAGPLFLILAGIGLLLCVSPTDPHVGSGSPSTHGLIHILGYFILVGSSILATVLLWLRLRKDARWRSYGWYSLITGMLALATFFLPQYNFYLFLVLILAWIEIIAIHLFTVSSGYKVKGG